jgi:hypothetical protein
VSNLTARRQRNLRLWKDLQATLSPGDFDRTGASTPTSATPSPLSGRPAVLDADGRFVSATFILLLDCERKALIS